MQLKLEMEVWMAIIHKNSLVAQTVKSPPAMQETWVQSLGREDPLEKGMTTHSSILAWRIPWTEEPGEVQSLASQRVRHDWKTNPSWKWRGSPGKRIPIAEGNSSRLYGTCGSSKMTLRTHPLPGPWNLEICYLEICHGKGLFRWWDCCFGC